jgi:hypothetical protein
LLPAGEWVIFFDMADKALDSAKDGLIDAITDAYSRGGMEMAAFERAVARITASPDVEALAGEASALGLALDRPARESGASRRSVELEADFVELSCVSGKLRQEGEWVRAERYRLYLKSSSARLDLEEYEGRRSFRLFIELEAISSSIRIDVPEGFEVQDRLSDRRSSTVRNKPKGSVYDDCIVFLSGSILSSTLRVRYH